MTNFGRIETTKVTLFKKILFQIEQIEIIIDELNVDIKSINELLSEDARSTTSFHNGQIDGLNRSIRGIRQIFPDCVEKEKQR